MPAVGVREMLAIEASAKADGWTEEGLLQRAGSALAVAIAGFFPVPGMAVGYLGKGHNAGDVIVALGVLRDQFGWKTGIRRAFPTEVFAPLTRGLLEASLLDELEADSVPPPPVGGPLLLIDGLLGIGSQGSPREPIAMLIREMNDLRTKRAAMVAAADLPSGLNADTGEAGAPCVVADLTLMIAQAKCGLLKAEAADFTGALALVPVSPLEHAASTETDLICPQFLEIGKAPRPFDFHKGRAGRVSLLVGSEDYPGAAVLAATGALRGGAGLITLHAPRPWVERISSRCPPEVIVRAFDRLPEALEHPADAWVVGCGLGQPTASNSSILLDWMEHHEGPMVLDADALNLLARSGRRSMLRGNHLITPHPGEFRRLCPELADLHREEQARGFARSHSATLLLKGARTLVHRQGSPLWCNSTGHPGMASGGQGDLLAGVIGALLAGGHPCIDAASLGAWICGRASEIAIWHHGHCAESLSASDTAERIGHAFNDWRCQRR